MSNYSISGIAKVGDSFKNIVINDNANFSDRAVKEVVYATEYGEVEALFGFSDLDIVELGDDDDKVNSAKMFINDNDYVEGIIFLSNGFLIVTDLMFFSAFTRIDGKDTPYVSIVESDTYEDDEASIMIEEDIRLQ